MEDTTEGRGMANSLYKHTYMYMYMYMYIHEKARRMHGSKEPGVQWLRLPDSPSSFTASTIKKVGARD